MPVDALGRCVETPREPLRVVSLVPSETESVVELAGIGRLAGRTEYCVEPCGTIERVPVVGGTKSVDVERVVALAPDLVLANREENTKADVEALIDAGSPFTSASRAACPKRSRIWGRWPASCTSPASPPRSFACAKRSRTPRRDAVEPRRPSGRSCRSGASPWMTFDGRAFASDVLSLAGAENVFADRARRYPLAADVGDAAPLADDRLGDRDTRYPRVTLAEVQERAPEVVLLPDEPYRFTPADRDALEALAMPAATNGRIDFIDGKELFWYGTRLATALDRVAKRIASRPWR